MGCPAGLDTAAEPTAFRAVTGNWLTAPAVVTRPRPAGRRFQGRAPEARSMGRLQDEMSGWRRHPGRGGTAGHPCLVHPACGVDRPSRTGMLAADGSRGKSLPDLEPASLKERNPHRRGNAACEVPRPATSRRLPARAGPSGQGNRLPAARSIFAGPCAHGRPARRLALGPPWQWRRCPGQRQGGEEPIQWRGGRNSSGVIPRPPAYASSMPAVPSRMARAACRPANTAGGLPGPSGGRR